jgi:hypothetical protein
MKHPVMEHEDQKGGEATFNLEFIPDKTVDVPLEGSYLSEDGFEFCRDGSIYTPDRKKSKIIADENGNILGTQYFHADGTTALVGEIITLANGARVKQEDLHLP